MLPPVQEYPNIECYAIQGLLSNSVVVEAGRQSEVDEVEVLAGHSQEIVGPIVGPTSSVRRITWHSSFEPEEILDLLYLLQRHLYRSWVLDHHHSL
jgi:hypothetical protein